MMTTPQTLPANAATKDDRIFRTTKLLAAIIAPFLVAAFYILFLRTSETGELFAWQISSGMTAMMLAAAYLGGVWYFVQVVLARRWHHIKIGLLPITAFASILGIATLLHWDKFNHASASFVTWTVVYLITPFLVPAVWLSNRRTDPGTPDDRDAVIPIAFRWAMGAAGVIAVVVSALLFLSPGTMVAVWPWPLTPLTARVAAAMFALQGLVGLGIGLDARWSSARVILQSQGLSIIFILIGVARAWSEFNPANPGTYVFIGVLLTPLIAIVACTLVMDARRQPVSVRPAP